MNYDTRPDDLTGILRHKQKHPDHDPDKGIWGDCYRTVLACLLRCDIDSVPNFVDPAVHKQFASDNFGGAIDEWLEQRGLRRVTVAFPQANNYEHKVNNVGHITRHFNTTSVGKNGYWLLVGRSKLGTNHVVICKADKIIHDPSDSGIVGPAIVGKGDDKRYRYYGHIITPFGE